MPAGRGLSRANTPRDCLAGSGARRTAAQHVQSVRRAGALRRRGPIADRGRAGLAAR